MSTRDILIVGGGLNGPALALALAAEGLRSTVIDAVPGDTRSGRDFDGRAYALALASVRLLKGVGVWNGVAGVAQPMRRIVVTDGKAGEGPAPFFLHFDQAEIEDGPMGQMVEDRHLRPALLAAMAESGLITVRDGVRVTAQSVTPGGVSVTLDTGEVLEGALIVGADGRGSGTADRAGIARQDGAEEGGERVGAAQKRRRGDGQHRQEAEEGREERAARQDRGQGAAAEPGPAARRAGEDRVRHGRRFLSRARRRARRRWRRSPPP